MANSDSGIGSPTDNEAQPSLPHSPFNDEQEGNTGDALSTDWNGSAGAKALAFLNLHHRYELPQTGVDVDPEAVGWLPRGAAAEEGLYGNHYYGDLRGLGWPLARRIMRLDRAIVRSYERAFAGSLYDRERAEERSDIWQQKLMSLDVGVASAVAAISAAKGTPVNSCNGGAVGGDHLEPFPLVAFHWRKFALPILADCVREAGLALWVGDYGLLILAADQLPRFIVFAEALHRRRGEIVKVHREAAGARRPRRVKQSAVQLDLLSLLDPAPGPRG